MDETNKKLVAYLGVRNHASARELAGLVGLTIPSIRYRLFQLMAKGIVGQEKARNHRVWWFLQDNETRAAHQAR
jgi:predicted ArsR family transcriptional regulator